MRIKNATDIFLGQEVFDALLFCPASLESSPPHEETLHPSVGLICWSKRVSPLPAL